MIKNFTVLIFLFFVQFVFSQDKPITFENYELNYFNSKFNVIDNKISEIILKSNNEFVFWKRPVYNTCLTWVDYSGCWEKKNDTIIFLDHYKIIESDSKLRLHNNSQNKFYSIKFLIDNKPILTNKNIEIKYIYDLDSDLDPIISSEKLSKNSNLNILFDKIPNHDKLASIGYKYHLSNGKNIRGYITNNEFINEKRVNVPNIATVTFIKSPKEDTIYRITKAILFDDKLKIISTDKSNTDLTNFSENLIFKSIYTKKKE